MLGVKCVIVGGLRKDGMGRRTVGWDERSWDYCKYVPLEESTVQK